MSGSLGWGNRDILDGLHGISFVKRSWKSRYDEFCVTIRKRAYAPNGSGGFAAS